MSSGVNHNINGVNHLYWDSLHMIDGAKPEIEGVNHDIDEAKCQVVE